MDSLKGQGPDYVGWNTASSADWQSLHLNRAIAGDLFNPRMRVKFENITPLSLIANTRVQNEFDLTSCGPGGRIDWFNDFKVNLFRRQRNAPPKLQDFDVRSSHCYMPTSPWEYALKFSQCDQAILDARRGVFTGGMNQVVSMIQDSAAKEINEIAVKSYLSEALRIASCDNQGNAAGAKHGNIRAGEVGAPVTVNPGNVHELYNAARSLLNQQNVRADNASQIFGDSGFVLIGDSRFEAILNASSLGQEWAMSCCDNMESYLTKGFAPGSLHGFSTLITDCLPCVSNSEPGTGVVIAMARGAGNFYGINTSFKMYEGDIFHGPDDKYAHGTFLFAHMFAYPEAVAVFQVQYEQTGEFFNS